MTHRLARHLLAAAVLSLWSLLPPHRAMGQVESREGIALQNQILELRRQVQTLQDQLARSGGSPSNLGRSSSSSGASDLVAQLLTRVDALDAQVRQLRGRTDETQNQVQRQGAELSKRIDDMAFQTQTPPAGAGGQGGAASQPPRPPASPSTLPLTPPPNALGGAPSAPPVQPQAVARRTPELAIQEGNAALARRDFSAAEQSAREVLSGSRTSPRAYDAQFLLAQALMGQRQYSQAAIAYDDTYNRSRKGAHAPDALLGLANSLIAINEKRAACDTLAKLRAEDPTPRPEIRDGINASAQRASCNK